MTVEARVFHTSLGLKLNQGATYRLGETASSWHKDMRPRMYSLTQLEEFEKQLPFFESLRRTIAELTKREEKAILSLVPLHPHNNVRLKLEDQETVISWTSCGKLLAKVFAHDLLELDEAEIQQGIVIARALEKGSTVTLNLN